MEKEPLHNPDLDDEVAKFEAVFAKELTPDLAKAYVASLVGKLGGADQCYEQFVEAGRKLHFDVGKEIYGPLIVGYCGWLKQHCQGLGHEGSVFFALRDAAPLKAAADVLWQGTNLTPVAIYANRPLLGVEDEIAPERSAQNGMVLDYLQGKGLGVGERAVLADTGAWGTVVKALKASILKDTPTYPFFWYSHNPHIPGYLNGLLAEAHIEDKFGEVVNDSLECLFPQPHLRPLSVVAGSSDVLLVPSNSLSVEWGNVALEGVAQSSASLGTILPEQEIAELKKLYALHESARASGSWTGVLPSNTPTWSQGDAFLASFTPDLVA